MLKRLFGRPQPALPPGPLTERIVRAADEAAGLEWYLTGTARKTETGKALLAAEPEALVDLTLTCFAILAQRRNRDDTDRRLNHLATDLAASALRRKLPFSEAQQQQLLRDLIAQAGRSRRLVAGTHPVAHALGAVEKRAGGAGNLAPAALHDDLNRIAGMLQPERYADDRKLVRRIQLLTGTMGKRSAVPAKRDPWARALREAGESHASASERVLTLAAGATTAKPTKAFFAQRDQLVTDAQAASVACRLLVAAVAVPRTELNGQVPPDLGDILRGLAWIAGGAGGDEAADALGQLALAGWKKIPGEGAQCQKAANAAIVALSGFEAGAPVLARLRSQLKQPNAVRAVDEAIGAAAERLGIPRAEFEERVVPRFGLDANGELARPLGDHTALLAVGRDGTCALRFRSATGRTLKTVPAAVKADHPEALAELKRTAKEITVMATAQRSRLERLLLERGRAWTYATWRERHVDHGLVSPLARRLIWSFDGRSATGELVAADGSVLPPPRPDATVRLWHPVDAEADEVQTWRHFLEEHEITQPFKQAHREVYLLTAAEQQTRVYSNRFAAHILRQHQMAALARARGWRYALQGAWDSGDEQATLELAGHDLSVAFWVERPWDSEDFSDSGVFNHVLSDQVRFTDRSGEPVPLPDIDSRVFSEVMRDVDLFVGVTSIGNDPNWADQGERRYQEYWQGYAFGELTEQAAIRRDLLQRLLPKLVLRDVATLDGRFLRVEGTLRTYKIHLGSGNILMEPNDQYLCIVPGRGTDPSSKVFLPFEGDQVLALILSKAFLLAKDDKIDDATIMSQIGG